ncbi:MAG TPA: thioredoxin family protein [Candidatus Dormibacteraeota bacterium]
MTEHKVVSHEEWLAARRQHLAKEKEFTRLRDEISRERRELPWEVVEKDYWFEGEHGRQSLAEVFDGRSQLVVYHAMFNPDTAGPNTPYTADAACMICSFWMDNFNGVTVHLNHRDVTMVAVSIAPYAKIEAYKRRMGWTFPWLSSAGSDFNFDYGVSFSPRDLGAGKVEYNYRPESWSMSEAPGISVFHRADDGRIYHTYSAYSRGLDMLNVAYHYLDLVPKGRDEAKGSGAGWVHRHDEYPN